MAFMAKMIQNAQEKAEQKEANPTQVISVYDFLNKRAAKKGGELTAQEYNDAVETYTQNYRNLAVRNFLGDKYTKEQYNDAEQNWNNAAAAFKRKPVDDTSDKGVDRLLENIRENILENNRNTAADATRNAVDEAKKAIDETLKQLK
ncbi:MAG: hypothetical protein RI956_274 [Pseudomonadota bacterium]|jgi:hypothetical protein